MRNMIKMTACTICFCSVGVTANAGDLNPPPGPVASTMKTLDAVEPRIPIGPDTTPGNFDATYVIAEPGSYYLTENLIGLIGDDGIVIEADEVTIDLMGFTLQASDSSGNAVGIADGPDGAANRVTVRNGFITGWDARGVNLRGEGIVLEDLIISGCGSSGATLGDRALVRRCIFASNGGNGLLVDENSIVEDCISDGNSLSGYVCRDGSVVTQCVSISNGFDGIIGWDRIVLSECVSGSNGESGIEAREHGQIADCVVFANQGNGIQAVDSLTPRTANISGCLINTNGGAGILAEQEDQDGSQIAGNVAAFNRSGGIITGDRNSILNNVLYSNEGGPGIGAGDDCLISGNLSARNEDDTGIRAFNSCRIVNNHVVENPGGGIVADLDCTIERNSVGLSGTSGISVDDRCLITGNNSESNGSRGIFVSGRECTITNNRIANNGTAGIELNGDRNFVFANFARDNAGNNFDAVTNNRFGPIVIPPLSGEIMGSTDPDVAGVGTTDPYANFSY